MLFGQKRNKGNKGVFCKASLSSTYRAWRKYPSPTTLPEQLKITKLRKGLSNLVSKNYWVETGPELLNQNIHGLAVPHPLIPSVV